MAAALAVAALVSAITAPVSALVAAVSGLIASEAPGGIGGQAAARVAMAEYQAVVADGTMHRNDPKYWEAVAGSGFSDASSTPWCACFVSWCLAEAGFADGDGAIAPTTTYTGDFIDYYAANPERGSVLGLKGPFAEMTADPQPGDIVCYGADEACSDHVGLVVETGTDAEGRRYFCTVEGNTGIGSADGTGVNMHRYTDANPSQMQSATAWWAGMDGWAYALVCRPAYPAPDGPIELPATDPATGKAIGTYGSIEYFPRDNWWDSDFAQARVQRAWNERGGGLRRGGVRADRREVHPRVHLDLRGGRRRGRLLPGRRGRGRRRHRRREGAGRLRLGRRPREQVGPRRRGVRHRAVHEAGIGRQRLRDARAVRAARRFGREPRQVPLMSGT